MSEVQWVWFSAAMFLISYFMPTFVARTRKHVNKNAIFMVNLFAGWTGLGWFGAMLWSISGGRDKN